jgi:hypothetical protein
MTGEPRLTQRGAGGLCRPHSCRIGTDRPLRRDARKPALARLGECFHADDRLDPRVIGLIGVTGARFVRSTTHPSCRRSDGGLTASLFPFDLACWSELTRWPATRVANSTLLKASFLGVLGLELPWSWRRGRRNRARADFLPVAAVRPVQTNTRDALPAGLSCQPTFDDRTGRAARCQGSLSTSRPVDRLESIFAGKSQHCQTHEGLRRMIVLLSAAFEPAGALTAETLAGSATGTARRLWQPLGSVETSRAPMWETYDPQWQRDRSKTHRSGGHP